MKFTKLKSNTVVNISVSDYNIDWAKVVSKPQKKTKDFLFTYWKTDHVLEEFRIPASLLRIDLLNLTKKIIIEVSPDKIHVEFNPWIHKDREGFIKKIQADENKRLWAERNNFEYIELYDEDLKQLSKDYIEKKFNINL